jgi:triosephosphate isomerase (TIM)
MTPGVRPLIAGNWKMNGLEASLAEIDAVIAAADEQIAMHLDLLLCPPFTLLAAAAERASGSALALGGQDCHHEASGAHTGDISAEMIADCGGGFVIVGHSERRREHGEGDADVARKANAAQRAGLVPVICIGETREEREGGRTLRVLERQIAASLPGGPGFAIAYEPVWAIGSGEAAGDEAIFEAHSFIRAAVSARFGAAGEACRLLYGGSVKAGNAASVLAIANVDGALIGGASLKADDFVAICRACAQAAR